MDGKEFKQKRLKNDVTLEDLAKNGLCKREVYLFELGCKISDEKKKPEFVKALNEIIDERRGRISVLKGIKV